MRSEGAAQVVRLAEAASGAFLSVRKLSVEAVVDGPMARTDLRITFANDLGRTIEGDLVFPLPPFAALCELTVRVGTRTLHGRFRPRERAQAEYHRAVQAGRTAVLGESEGEDLGRLRVAPIETGEDVEVSLVLLHTLVPISDGHRLLLPLTYMPRYVENEQGLKPTERAAVERPRPVTSAARGDVKVSIRKGAAPVQVRCPTHGVQTRDEGQLLEVSVSGVPLDRDLHLEIQDRQRGDLPTLWVRHDASDGRDGLGPSTAVALLPPPFADEGVTVARTLLLLVDRSGSMDGEPMAAAIRAVKGCLRALGPSDRFNVIAFTDSLEALARRPLPFDDGSLRAADAFADSLSAGGGTEAAQALTAVLDDDLGRRARSFRQEGPAPDASHRLRVVVMMTDGDVGSAENVLTAAKDRLIDTRLFVIGIGHSVNHAMLARLAELGSGTYTPVSSNEDLERALNKLKGAIDAPLLTSVTVRLESGGQHSEPAHLEPAGRLDLFAGQPLLLGFRGRLAADAMLHVTAQRPDGEDVKISVPVRPDPGAVPIDAETAALVWALLRNRRLTYKFDPGDNATLEALGTTFGLVNRSVALVGVHAEQRNTDAPENVPVVLPLPGNLDEEGGARNRSVSAPASTGGPPGGAVRAKVSRRAPASPAAKPLQVPSPSVIPSPARPVMLSQSMPMPMPAPAPAPAQGSGMSPSFDAAAPEAADEDDAEVLAPSPEPMAREEEAKIAPPPMSRPARNLAPPPPAKAPSKKKGGSVLGRIAKAFGVGGSDDEADAGAPPSPAAPVPAPPPPARSVSVPAEAAPVPAAADTGDTAAPRFSDDEAGLRALLLQQGADGLFAGDLGATLAAVAALVSRGHTARSGGFRAELRRTVQALQARLAKAQGKEQVLCALALAILRVPGGDAAPSELPAELAASLAGASLTDLPGLAAAVRAALAKAPDWKQSPLARGIAGAFLSA